MTLAFMSGCNATAPKVGKALKPTERPMKWSKQAGWSPNNLSGVHFGNGKTGWAVGQNGGILVTKDGGQAWTPQASGITAFLLGVHFPSATAGWAVGEN